ncbi:hypothetical protein RFI_09643 [Reticulomyxa filosa]|uniref:Uncharacterized protein n=1 Tax=Reticulomyxa filosa TaxID=46433 RepID=X6LPW5_RETFI|nr:hypothetical protein RFI_33474 [Reticulomyxa filosa]ETO27490.1 hypothetical protein RFI_09643 [Reticulomyxa filosa]|eukprot:ETO03928.1 hypothetical protein RFI_33474 [Reticulomyxa filosa]
MKEKASSEQKKENGANGYFVDKRRYDELIKEHDLLQQAYDSLLEQCEQLELQNEILRGQSAYKIEDIAKMHEKVNAWASRFGMRRPTLSSLDDTTINEIHSLIQTKEQHKTHRSYHSSSHLPNSRTANEETIKNLIGDYEAPILLAQADNPATHVRRNSHSKS